MKGGEPVAATIGWIGYYFYHVLFRISGDKIDKDLPMYITNLLVLLLRELKIDDTPEGKEELNRIVNMTDQERDIIFQHFLYPNRDEDGFEEYQSEEDPRILLKYIYKNHDEIDKIIPTVLKSIQEVDVYISREDLNSYLKLLEEFNDYLYLNKYEKLNNFSYDDQGKRIYKIEGQTAAKKHTNKYRKKNKKHKRKSYKNK